MKNVICQSWFYWLIASVYSIYQGYRGFVAQKQLVKIDKNNLSIEKTAIEVNLLANVELNKEQNKKLKDDLLKAQGDKFVFYAYTNCQTVWLRAIPYCFFYFTTTFLGFISLFFVYYILTVTSNLNDISGGTAALIIFAVLYGLIGVTGQLPSLIEQGKLPK